VAAGEPIPAIVTSQKPGKAVRRSEASDERPVPDSVREFFKRMLRPPGDG
jgi:hypothetical protein